MTWSSNRTRRATTSPHNSGLRVRFSPAHEAPAARRCRPASHRPATPLRPAHPRRRLLQRRLGRRGRRHPGGRPCRQRWPTLPSPTTRARRINGAPTCWSTWPVTTWTPPTAPTLVASGPTSRWWLDLATLLHQPGARAASLLDGGAAITGEAARRLCCDAQVSRIITNGP